MSVLVKVNPKAKWVVKTQHKHWLYHFDVFCLVTRLVHGSTFELSSARITPQSFSQASIVSMTCEVVKTVNILIAFSFQPFYWCLIYFHEFFTSMWRFTQLWRNQHVSSNIFHSLSVYFWLYWQVKLTPGTLFLLQRCYCIFHWWSLSLLFDVLCINFVENKFSVLHVKIYVFLHVSVTRLRCCFTTCVIYYIKSFKCNNLSGWLFERYNDAWITMCIYLQCTLLCHVCIGGVCTRHTFTLVRFAN